MADLVSIIIAIVSLVGSLAAAGFTGWISFYIDKLKRRSEAKALNNKYRDPLTLSAYDLQSRLYNILESGLLDHLQDNYGRELVQLYTAYLVGQYLSWVYIFRREAQFLRFSTDKSNKTMNRIMSAITKEFSQDKRPEESAFMLWRGQQLGIGEIMTLREEGGQSYCMGFSTFMDKYNNEDPGFKWWFTSIESSILQLAEARRARNREAQNRLRRLQHLLIDLVCLLGGDMLSQDNYAIRKVTAAPECECDRCPSEKLLPLLDV